MPPKAKVYGPKNKKTVCHKPPYKYYEVLGTPQECFKKGVKAGFVAGINKGINKQKRFTKKVLDIAPKLAVLKYKSEIEQPVQAERGFAGSDVLRATAGKVGLPIRGRISPTKRALRERGVNYTGISMSRNRGVFGRGKMSA